MFHRDFEISDREGTTRRERLARAKCLFLIARAMSALGQKQTCPQVDVTCPFHSKADIPRRHDNVRLMP
jgi:hypothetical protein